MDSTSSIDTNNRNYYNNSIKEPSAHKAASEFNQYIVNGMLEDFMIKDKNTLYEEDNDKDNPFLFNSYEQKVYNKFLINEMAIQMTNNLPKSGVDIVYSYTKNQLEKDSLKNKK
ncbi:hypothetical protein [Lyticum sinuosum]|uniref:Uncharacterized protein n=1 Tax=Lyticum sinuosum TaxID=1332059 RepID=A0AAE4VJD4_9RICK|nr:hypothetical protein [Lyticum sinuosum]MDZ5760887.1 hypothetical protein [Lyticum sinuosum]